jgi:enterochelin esterase-like enzyme
MAWPLLLLSLGLGQPVPEPCQPDRPCEVRLNLSPAAVDALIGPRTEAWWINADVLTVVARRESGATLCCAIQRPMRPLGRGLQAVSVRIPDIDSAILDITVLPTIRQGFGPTWRGPAAPPEPEHSEASFRQLRSHAIESVHLGSTRRIIVYVPPGLADGQSVPVIYLADSLATSFANIADAFIRRGRSTPVILVGIPSASPAANAAPCNEARCDPRNQEYLIDIPDATPGQRRFDIHDRFVMEEVIPFVEAHYPVIATRDGRATMGFSSGAAWAVATAARHPETFGNVIGLSLGWRPAALLADQLGEARVFLAAGRLESGRFLERTTEAASLARAAGADVKLLVPNGGHGFGTWDLGFAEALVWMFPARPADLVGHKRAGGTFNLGSPLSEAKGGRRRARRMHGVRVSHLIPSPC